MLFDYFLLDSVDRDSIRRANNSLVLRADEIWVFGEISNGALSEILIAQEVDKPIRYFKIEKPHQIIPTEVSSLQMEPEIEQHKNLIYSNSLRFHGSSHSTGSL
jgi:hypothetical protein